MDIYVLNRTWPYSENIFGKTIPYSGHCTSTVKHTSNKDEIRLAYNNMWMFCRYQSALAPTQSHPHTNATHPTPPHHPHPQPCHPSDLRIWHE